MMANDSPSSFKPERLNRCLARRGERAQGGERFHGGQIPLLRRFETLEVPKSPIGEAVTQVTNQWPTLGVYLTDGVDRQRSNESAGAAPMYTPPPKPSPPARTPGAGAVPGWQGLLGSQDPTGRRGEPRRFPGARTGRRGR